MKTQNETTPFDQKLFLIFIVTFATMTVFEFAGQFLYPYPPDWRSNLITSLFTSGIAVIIAYFPLNNYYENNARLLGEVKRREQAEQALLAANKKLSTLSTITRHDIKNQLTGVSGYLQIISKKEKDNPTLKDLIDKLTACSQTIEHQVEFTQYYEELGTSGAGWYDIRNGILEAGHSLPLDGITLDPGPAGIAIYADPLVSRVYYNILENSIRHGGHVTAITCAASESEDGLRLTISDNGVGVPVAEKEKIFLRGYGKNTGLGLFLIREILATTGISIRETGVPDEGARFEIQVPKGVYRFSQIPGAAARQP